MVSGKKLNRERFSKWLFNTTELRQRKHVQLCTMYKQWCSYT